MLASGIVTRAVGVAGTIAASLARNHTIHATGGVAKAKTLIACEEQTRLRK